MKTIALDVETTGLDPYRGHTIFAWSSCDEEGGIEVHRADDWKSTRRCWELLQELLLDTSIAKVCHNYHFEYAMFKMAGLEIPPDTIWHDTMIISQMLNNLELSHGLDALADRYGPDAETRKEWRRVDAEIARARGIYGTYDKIPEHLMTPYQAQDVERTMLLFQTFFPKLFNDKPVYRDYLNEIELVQTTVEMEMHGVMVDRKEIAKLLVWMGGELEQVTEDIPRICGKSLNLNSGPQMLRYLYGDLRLPTQFNKKTKKPSVDKDAIENLRAITPAGPVHDALDLILKYRSYTKGVSMVQSYLTAADANGILHPHINTNMAATGRESSTNPNMQNISKEVSLRSKFTVPARRCFRARPRTMLWLVDYAGIEMRLAVQGTGSQRLIDLLEEDFDFHDACASAFYGHRYTDPEECMKFFLEGDQLRQKSFRELCDKIGRAEALEKTAKIAKKMLRSAAKNGRFAMLYGAGIAQVSDTLVLSLEEARAGCERDKEVFPEFYTFMNECTKKARTDGYIETFFGRKLYVDPKKPYKATDYKIQGSAAALFKRAQNRARNVIKNKYAGLAQLILPVHDELVFEVKREVYPDRFEFMEDIQEIMFNYPEITVKLSAEWKISTTTWDKAEEVKV